jgi:hypothetical protein
LKRERPTPADRRHEFYKAFGEPLPQYKEPPTLDEVSSIARPSCLHGVKLTLPEWTFESSYKRRYHTLGSPWKSFECVRCHPVCVHGRALTSKEAQTQIRYSATCFGCNQTITDRALIQSYLKLVDLSTSRGKSLREGEFITSYGLPIVKGGDNFIQGGGSKQVEDVFANRYETIDCGDEVATQMKPGGPTTQGFGPDSAEDFDGVTTDSLGDPIASVPIATIEALEDARRKGKSLEVQK